MKLFGKKTLAVVLTLVVALTLCSVTAFAGEAKYILVDEQITLTAPSAAGSATVTWSSDAEGKATVSNGVVTGVSAGTATITASWPTTGEGGAPGTASETWNVTVVAKTATAVALKTSGDATLDVPYGATFNESALSGIKFEVSYGVHIKKEVTAASWSAGDDTLNTSVIGDEVTYTPTLTGISLQVPTVTARVVKATTASGVSTNIGTMTVLVGTSEEYIKEMLPDYKALSLNNGQAETFSIGSYTNASNVNGCYNAWTTSNYNDDYTGTYTFTATAKEHANYEMPSLTYTVKAVDSNFDINAVYSGTSLSSTVSSIDDILKGMYNDSLYSIYFDEMDMYGGELYIKDSSGALIPADTGEYTISEIADMIYYPNGSGDESDIYYIAYTSDDDYDEYIEGTITIDAPVFALVTWELDNKDFMELDGAEFEDAFLLMNEDYEELKSIKFTHTNGASKGYLYYDYDSSDKTGTNASSKEMFYDPEGTQTGIDEVVYVPGSSMTEGVHHLSFKAAGYNYNGNSVTNKQGYVRIFLTESADLTVEAGKGELVYIDPSWFEDIMEEYDTTTQTLTLKYVTFSGAPRTQTKGYLYTDDANLTASSSKSFYADADDVDVSAKKYDLYDLYYKGGTSANTTRGTFTIYYTRSGSPSTIRKVENCTIDFIVGNSHTLSGAIKASEVMKFSSSLSAFEELGGNDNDYIVFTSLPVGGKLVYNWGTASQEDVKLNTEYWLSYKAGKKLMSNVTFVPSYSASKVQKNVTIGIKGYDDNKAVTGTINIAVTHASYSVNFYDITTNAYADSVDFLFNQGITTGMTATTFGPNNNVTRAQFVTFLWRAAGSPAVTGITNTFTDVKPTGTYAYAYQAILWAVQNNITTGRSTTVFDPAANVTHQEMVTFLYRYDVNYLGHSGAGNTYVSYTGWSTVPDYAQTPAKWAAYKGILVDSTTYPTTAGSRATIALWLHRMLTL